jgi:hypothetical protein
MKIKPCFSFLLLMAILMTGCTRYASASPTPAAATAETKFELPTPTLMALDAEVATRTPIPLVLKTATPTLTVNEEQATTPSVEMNVAITDSTTGQIITVAPAAGTTAGTASGISTTTAYSYKTATSVSIVAPTRAPQVVLAGNPTVSIVHVKYADSITLNITGLPVNSLIGIRMGTVGSYGADGATVETVKSDANGAVSGTFKLPQAVVGYSQIGVRIEYPDGYTASFYFGNMEY